MPLLSIPSTARMRLIAVLLIAVLVALGFTHTFGDPSKAKNAKPPVLVTQVTVLQKPMPVEIGTIGHVQAISSVAVKARLDGQIARVLVQDGQDVTIGDTLFQLDDRTAQAQLAQARATLAKDEAQLAYAQRDATRQQALVKKGAVSASAQEQTTANAAALAATVEADRAMVSDMETQLSYTVITAPIAGKIGSINSKEGNTVEANGATPLVTINQLAPIFVSFSVAQASLPALQDALANGTVKAQAIVPGKESDPQTGEIAYIDNAIDPATGTLPVRAKFANDSRRLWPGQFVNVVVTLKVEPHAIVVASAAVQMGQSGPYVFVVTTDHTVDMRPVQVDRVMKDETIVTRGVKAGEIVVTSNQLRLTPGAKVKTEAPKPEPRAKGPTS